MPFTRLLQLLENLLQRPVFCGTPTETLQHLQNGSHPDPVLGPMLQTMVEWCAIRDTDQLTERAASVNALGPLRLKLMGEDSDVHAYRLIGQLIAAIDEAFDLEASKPDPRELH